jgi:hypothetical protein
MCDSGIGVRKVDSGIGYYNAINSTDIKALARLLNAGHSVPQFEAPSHSCADYWKPNRALRSEIKQNLSQVGKVSSLEVILNHQLTNSYIFANNMPNFILENTVRDRLSIYAVIECRDAPLLIKEELVLSDEKNCHEQVISSLQKTVLKYKSVSKKKFIDINGKLLNLILPCADGGIFIHEAIGHSLEADYFYSKNSIIRKHWHKKIAHSDITVIDSCKSTDLTSFECSSDGSSPSDVVLIDKGFVTGVLTDLQHAETHKILNTGNGRSSGYEFKAIPRMRNTYLANGKFPFNDILESTSNGLLATEIGGGEVNSLSGDFMFNISAGLVVVEGEVAGISKPVLFVGNVFEAFAKIDMVGDDLAFKGAICGKKGQFIDVSYGTPTIRFEPMIMGAS